MNTAVKYILLTIGFALIGFLTFDLLQTHSFQHFQEHRIQLQTSSVTGLFNGYWWFLLATSCIPLLTFVVHRIAKLKSTMQFVWVYLIIILTGIAFWQLRLIYLVWRLETSAFTTDAYAPQVHLDVSLINAGFYFAFGLLIGFILSAFIFKVFRGEKEEKA